jgi:hypothetical protein
VPVAAAGLTVAVNVAADPNVEGFTADVSVVEVTVLGLTVTLIAFGVAPASFASPL